MFSNNSKIVEKQGKKFPKYLLFIIYDIFTLIEYYFMFMI